MLQKQPSVVALNGPPHSGKTFIIKLLQELIPDAVVVYPSQVLYEMMQEDGLAPATMKYHDYKKLPDSRDRLILASQDYRARDHHVYERRIAASQLYRESRVVIVDNVGHVPEEMRFYDKHSEASLLLRIDTPYQELEPLKSRARRMKHTWERDSRTPLEHTHMLTAYDSLQLTLLLRWLDGPLTAGESGPYHGIKQLWDRYFAAGARESTHVLQWAGASGQLGGLGETTLVGTGH